MTKLLILASDPELFVKSNDGILSSVAGALGCSKVDKLDLGGIRIQEDNVLVEFDIDPYDNFSEFDTAIMRGINECQNLISPLGLQIAPKVSSHIYSDRELKSFHASAFVFGCTPDYNALTGLKNTMPEGVDPGLRSAGGHIHFGWDQVTGSMESDHQKIVAVMCDYFLGMTSLMLDNDSRRRELYGKAGATRFKPYGIEYRTLSNFWIFEKNTRKWAWDQSQKAFNFFQSGDWQELVSMIDPNEVQRTINAGDLRMAEQYIRMAELV